MFPSLNEAFGLVAVEAMEYGIPVVASNEGGIPEVVEDGLNGFLTERGSATSLAEAIQKLIDNPELRIQMGKAGRQRFEERFTEQTFEETMRECLIQSILQK